MAETKECPLCGESMQMTIHDRADRVPGTTEVTTRQAREWVCPECDNFEEAESGEG